MLEKATRLCEAAFGMIHTFDGTALRLAARLGIPPLFAVLPPILLISQAQAGRRRV
jgi:hypothetical protein